LFYSVFVGDPGPSQVSQSFDIGRIIKEKAALVTSAPAKALGELRALTIK
jgi:hypothetical protein